MKRVNVTITSKNQITIPAEYVRQMKLSKNRRLSIHRRGDELVLKPEPSLKETLSPIWEEIKPFIKGTLTDEELNRAIRDAYSIRWDELKKEGRA